MNKIYGFFFFFGGGGSLNIVCGKKKNQDDDNVSFVQNYQINKIIIQCQLILEDCNFNEVRVRMSLCNIHEFWLNHGNKRILFFMESLHTIWLYSGTLLYWGPLDHKNYLVISGLKTKKCKELGPANLPCYIKDGFSDIWALYNKVYPY